MELEGVIEALDMETIYEVPLQLREQKLDDFLLERLGIETPAPDLTAWTEMVERVKRPTSGEVRIAVVGKYTDLVDSYKSIQEALIHGGISNDLKVRTDWLSSEQFEQGRGAELLRDYHGLLIPGGFGPRGV